MACVVGYRLLLIWMWRWEVNRCPQYTESPIRQAPGVRARDNRIPTGVHWLLMSIVTAGNVAAQNTPEPTTTRAASSYRALRRLKRCSSPIPGTGPSSIDREALRVDGTNKVRRTSKKYIVLVALNAACVHSGAEPLSPPVYPQIGFGRVGCFAGPSLDRMSEDTSFNPRSAIPTGPWLVLDSLSVVEWRRAYPEYSRQVDEHDLHPATLLVQRDTLTWTGGYWRRIAGDSILIQELSMFPPATWRLAATDAGFVGSGEVVSDLVNRAPDGTIRNRRFTWAVVVAEIPCGRVPLRPVSWRR